MTLGCTARRVRKAGGPPPAPIIKGLWDWQEAKAAFIVEVRRTKREATYVDYRNMLGTAELTRFDGREVGKITL